MDPQVCSADAYFQQEANGSGNYNFDASRIKEAHRHCKLQFEEALENKRELVIIDNGQQLSHRPVESGNTCRPTTSAVGAGAPPPPMFKLPRR